jgi:hypothetical protein
MRLALLTAAAALALAAAATSAQAERPNEGRSMMRALKMGGLEGKKLEKAIAKAETKPLGSKDNPIRENMPVGEIAYLSRLRCPGGETPAFERGGNVGTGVYRNIIDVYAVTCPGAAPVQVYMDMYHDGPETRPVPGFTIEPLPAG